MNDANWPRPAQPPQVPGFGGAIYAVVSGKGATSVAEIAVLEAYLASLTGAA